MVELTLPAESPYAGRRVGDLELPGDTVLVGIIREEHPIAPSRDDSIEPADELLFITTPEDEDALEAMLSPGERAPRQEE
jgi:trk system potassium uptake protein TrkA